MPTSGRFCRLFMGIMESELQPCTGKQEGVIKADYAGEYETGIRCLLCAQKSPRPSVFFELELYTKVIKRLKYDNIFTGKKLEYNKFSTLTEKSFKDVRVMEVLTIPTA